MKIVRLFILNLLLFACGDNAKTATDSFVEPRNNKDKNMINEWTDEEKFNIQANCLKDGLNEQSCICMVKTLTRNISFHSYIQLEDNMRAANKEEQKVLESIENCFKGE